MFRSVAGFAGLAVVAVIGLKLLMGLFGAVMGLLFTLLWWVFLAFVIYTLLKIFAPGVAQRVKETVRGSPNA